MLYKHFRLLAAYRNIPESNRFGDIFVPKKKEEIVKNEGDIRCCSLAQFFLLNP